MKTISMPYQDYQQDMKKNWAEGYREAFYNFRKVFREAKVSSKSAEDILHDAFGDLLNEEDLEIFNLKMEVPHE